MIVLQVFTTGELVMDETRKGRVNAAQLFLQHRLQHQIEKQSTKDAGAIAREAVRCYLENMNLVDVLARTYGFDYVFFWEPTIHNADKPLTSDEESAREAASKQSPGLEQADRAARDLIRAKSFPHLFDVADVFDQVPDTIYFDQAHVSAEGNHLVARRIYEILQQRHR